MLQYHIQYEFSIKVDLKSFVSYIKCSFSESVVVLMQMLAVIGVDYISLASNQLMIMRMAKELSISHPSNLLFKYWRSIRKR